MAARWLVAAAHGSAFRCSFLMFLYVFVVCLCTTGNANAHYTRQDLTDIREQHQSPVSRVFHHVHNIPYEIARPAGSPWIVVGSRRRRRWRRERKQRRGCRSGVMLRLRKQPYKPPLPSLYLANTRSLVYKTDYLELQLAGNRYVRDCCLLIITETWLHPDIPNASMQLAGCTLLRWDRTKDSGKSRGGGLCIYVHDNWCNNGTIIDKYSSLDLEYMSVRCRPFFLPRELTVVIVTVVYIPPDANVNIALSLLLNAMNGQQQAYPDGVHIIAGDLNKANLKSVLPRFYQHVKFSTRGEKAAGPDGVPGKGALVGLISRGDKAAYREEVLKLATWCSENKSSGSKNLDSPPCWTFTPPAASVELRTSSKDSSHPAFELFNLLISGSDSLRLACRLPLCLPSESSSDRWGAAAHMEMPLLNCSRTSRNLAKLLG
ncbi:hypothetical protein QQF64_007838 [Cirrhinus molitorella]|uniref:Endonuclease/exonuclease/phosphatase domain-containing protein n=1 Tax=Cirrhinus molitorella TaxID=172907 RepID=A0ABR3M6S7_9TELE